MKTYTIPHTDLEVSRIAYGCMGLGGGWARTPALNHLGIVRPVPPCTEAEDAPLPHPNPGEGLGVLRARYAALQRTTGFTPPFDMAHLPRMTAHIYQTEDERTGIR